MTLAERIVAYARAQVADSATRGAMWGTTVSALRERFPDETAADFDSTVDELVRCGVLRRMDKTIAGTTFDVLELAPRGDA